MLLTADPEVRLRIKDVRSVFNGVFVDQANLVSDDVHERLTDYIHRRHHTMTTGDVDSSGTIFMEDGVHEDTTLLKDTLTEYLESYGFVESPAQREQVVDNATFMATRGAVPHVDSYNSEWDETLFWVYVLESSGADLVFANLGLRFTMAPGQLWVFDPHQPHAVMATGRGLFRHCDFPEERRQSYLAGHMTYGAKFWAALGETTNAAALQASDLLDIQHQVVNVRSGRIQRHAC